MKTKPAGSKKYLKRVAEIEGLGDKAAKLVRENASKEKIWEVMLEIIMKDSVMCAADIDPAEATSWFGARRMYENKPEIIQAALNSFLKTALSFDGTKKQKETVAYIVRMLTLELEKQARESGSENGERKGYDIGSSSGYKRGFKDGDTHGLRARYNQLGHRVQ